MHAVSREDGAWRCDVSALLRVGAGLLVLSARRGESRATVRTSAACRASTVGEVASVTAGGRMIVLLLSAVEAQSLT